MADEMYAQDCPCTALQISYMLVFFLEYAGPLFIYPFFWSTDGRRLLHGDLAAQHERTVTQDLAFFYWSVHYAKVRSTIFVR